MAYNKVILQGNLVRDVETRYSTSGSAIGSSAIAVTKKFKKQDGTQAEKTLFVDVVAYGRTAEIMNNYLQKGSSVLIDGELELDQWTAQDGSKRSKHKIKIENLQMLGGKDKTQNSNEAPSQGQYSQPQHSTTQNHWDESSGQQSQQAAIPEIDIAESEIPFAPIGRAEGGHFVHII
jgi:single-strand DNA-binding protein